MLYVFFSLRYPCRADDIAVPEPAAEVDIFLNGIGTDEIVLHCNTEHGMKLMLGYRAHISAVDAHRTLVHIVKTHKERKERGLSASRCSDDTERSALWQRKA